MRTRTRLTLVLLTAVVATAAGCASRPNPTTTRIQIEDLDETVARMAQSLASSEFLAQRTPESEPIYITINRVENLTTDIIPPAEQWMLMARVQGSMELRHLAENLNIHFQVPPERRELVRGAGYEGTLHELPRTTHMMHAVFMSAPRTGTEAQRRAEERYVGRRTDHYYLEYSITNLETREVKWMDTFEFSREAWGLAID